MIGNIDACFRKCIYLDNGFKMKKYLEAANRHDSAQ